MANILCLETASTNCSVAVVSASGITVVEDHGQNYSHGEQLHHYILDALEQAELQQSDLDAIAVSKGPGSYTGLRIGVSSAKGLCYAHDLPLLSVPTLQSLAGQLSVQPGEMIIPLLDARRMEVYSAVFDHKFQMIRATQAEIVEESSFSPYLAQGKVHFIGTGVEKCKTVIRHKQAVFHEHKLPSAREMAAFAKAKFQQKLFEDVAYFEPFYLKEFLVTKKKSK
ncbi:tRNA (adenosine(37)-N6)-threonylcarbamoyltransferase complex dimerization subunit type 1 TsaB [Croceiramulus getboli]|nr:tRNA (adenosine(37)-N6)-threonylcarbamoyltransferase complex dimerization subunit type 1 TsaB [Flavobacteriaceae bacterium YJPT1-3]